MGIPKPLPCFSFSNAARFAGPPFESRLRRQAHSSSFNTAIASKQSPLSLEHPGMGIPKPLPCFSFSNAARFAGPPFESRLQRQGHSSSFSTAIKASVGSCTVPRFRIFFLPAPQDRRSCGDPSIPILRGGNEFRLAPRFCSAKHLYAASAAARSCSQEGKKQMLYRSLFVQLQYRHKGFCGQLHRAQVPHLLFARPTRSPILRGPLNTHPARRK